MRIVATSPLHDVARTMLPPRHELVVAPDESAATLRIVVGDADALIVRVRLPDDIFDHAPRLKACVRHGVGLDFIPVAAATAAGVPVANLPDANTQAVIEHVVGVTLMLARRFDVLDARLRSEGWSVRGGGYGLELRGRTLGIVGLGRIGLGVAAAMHGAFGMQVLGCDPFPAPRLPDYIAQVPIEQLFETADVVSLHAPLLPATAGLIDAGLLARARPGMLLVNAARGALTDETALIAALREGRLGGAAIDVFEPEPLQPDHPLLGLENVVLTPHTAAFTQEGLVRMSGGAMAAALAILSGARPENLVNPEVWPGFLKRWNLSPSPAVPA